MAGELEAIAEHLRRSTVYVRDGGSGVVWQWDGVIVTNAHVVRARQQQVELPDGRVVPTTVIKRDPRRDLALLRTDSTGATAAGVRDSSSLRSGEIAIAIGRPLGFRGALSTGVIHGSGPVDGLGRQSWVQADIRLAPGNSGGPLADADGRVVGINTMIAGRLALAVPSNDVSAFVAENRARPWLGVTICPIASGILVLEVEPDSPASRASLFPGDILTGMTIDQLHNAIERRSTLTLRFLRGDRRVREVAVCLAA